MVDLSWKTEYETGYDRIDWEHQVFLDLVAEFVLAVEEEQDQTLVLRLAHEIYKYADFHFFSEERVMVKIGYSDTDHHRHVHRVLLEELRSFVDSLSTDICQAGAMARFLVRWFLSHTANEDHKLAARVAEFRAEGGRI
jgi:hemerythrin